MALDRGINSLDTANVYGPWGERGGDACRAGAQRPPRPRRAASKVHARMDDDDPNAAGNSRRHVIDQCHATLKRLSVDHLDVYYVHRPGGRLAGDESDWVRRHFVPAAFAVVNELAALAAAKGCTPTQLALAWTLARPEVSSIVLGARTPEQLEDQLTALDVRLDPTDVAHLDAASPPGRAIVPYYLDDDLADWRAHRRRW